jgi:hypothetical protein
MENTPAKVYWGVGIHDLPRLMSLTDTFFHGDESVLDTSLN